MHHILKQHKIYKMVEKIWIQDTTPILLKYDKLNARIRKMADKKTILIKYNKLGASIRKMKEDVIPRYKVYTDEKQK